MSDPIQFFNLTCPHDADYFICEGYTTEFMGCCRTSPCNTAKHGNCSQEDLRPASFESDKYGSLPAQDCVNASTQIWWTCAYTDPPFVGCCLSNPCPQGYNQGSPKPSGFSHAGWHPSPETQHRFSNVTAAGSRVSQSTGYHIREHSAGTPRGGDPRGPDTL